MRVARVTREVSGLSHLIRHSDQRVVVPGGLSELSGELSLGFVGTCDVEREATQHREIVWAVTHRIRGERSAEYFGA